MRLISNWSRMAALPAVAAILATAGCVVPEPEPVTIELINQTGLDVTPNFFVSASAGDSASLFGDVANRVTDFNDRPFPELRANEIATIEIPCESIASMGVQRPVLFDGVTLTVTPSSDVIFLARDAEFACGGSVRFYFYREGTAFRVRLE